MELQVAAYWPSLGGVQTMAPAGTGTCTTTLSPYFSRHFCLGSCCDDRTSLAVRSQATRVLVLAVSPVSMWRQPDGSWFMSDQVPRWKPRRRRVPSSSGWKGTTPREISTGSVMSAVPSPLVSTPHPHSARRTPAAQTLGSDRRHPVLNSL